MATGLQVCWGVSFLPKRRLSRAENLARSRSLVTRSRSKKGSHFRSLPRGFALSRRSTVDRDNLWGLCSFPPYLGTKSHGSSSARWRWRPSHGGSWEHDE